MKKTNQRSFGVQCFSLLIIVLFSVLTLQSNAQSMNYGRNRFVFKNGIKEWSDTLKTNLGSNWMTKKGQPYVDLGFRLRLMKKVILACHYEVEITNLSAKDGIRFELDNGYTKNTVKLKAGQTKVVKLIFADLKCKLNNEQDCAKCDWDIIFHEVEGY